MFEDRIFVSEVCNTDTKVQNFIEERSKGQWNCNLINMMNLPPIFVFTEDNYILVWAKQPSSVLGTEVVGSCKIITENEWDIPGLKEFVTHLKGTGEYFN